MEESQLQPTIERAKTTLRSALHEACRANLDRADTGELIRIEEVLAIANEAAKEVISVRRRLSSRKQAAEVPKETESEERSAPGVPASREVRDTAGIVWRVFAVYPSNRSGRPAVRDRFRDGWLSFDCEVETRR